MASGTHNGLDAARDVRMSPQPTDVGGSIVGTIRERYGIVDSSAIHNDDDGTVTFTVTVPAIMSAPGRDIGDNPFNVSFDYRTVSADMVFADSVDSAVIRARRRANSEFDSTHPVRVSGASFIDIPDTTKRAAASVDALYARLTDADRIRMRALFDADETV